MQFSRVRKDLNAAVFIPNAVALILIAFAQRFIVLVGAAGDAAATAAGLQQRTLIASCCIGRCTANGCIDAIVHKKRGWLIVVLQWCLWLSSGGSGGGCCSIVAGCRR